VFLAVEDGGRSCTFIVYLGLPEALCVVDGAVVVYACREEVWCAFLGRGGLDGEHGGGGGYALRGVC
jgi:hypothetical protein